MAVQTPRRATPQKKGVRQPHKEALRRRLNRIGGQVQGIARMIEEDRYCVDILAQVGAARAALDRVALQLIEDHTKGCVRRAIKEGKREEEAIGELMEVLERFTR
jgi:DNA-binding FrmR family transcriptional regulator